MKEKYRIKMIALCGIFSAAELVILYLSSVFQILDLVIASMTVLFTIVLMAEYGKKPVSAVYIVVSVLSMLIVPHKFSPLCYIFFLGFYPIVKPFFDDVQKALGYVLKLLYFNGCYIVVYSVAAHFAMLDDIAGVGTVMFVQGLNSLNVNAQPLVVVDGVIIDQQYGRQLLHDGFFNDKNTALSVFSRNNGGKNDG